MSWRPNHDARLRATAYHEAGHAVAAQALGLHVESISIAEDRESAGRVRYRSGSGSRWTRARVVMCLAGPISERWATGVVDVAGANSDLGSAWKLLRGIAREERDVPELLSAAWESAESIVADCWSEVARLADRLLDGIQAAY